MPVRIYEISKKLGLENKEVLAKAKELGIAAKVASSSLDKITAQYLEEQLGGVKKVETKPEPIPAPTVPEPIKVISQPVEIPAAPQPIVEHKPESPVQAPKEMVV